MPNNGEVALARVLCKRETCAREYPHEKRRADISYTAARQNPLELCA